MHVIDRRYVRRLPLNLSLRYRFVDGTLTPHTGIGMTCNLSSTGVLFEADRSFAPGYGGLVELLIDWPALYHGEEPMELLLRGTLIRIEENRAALRVLHHDFIPYRIAETLDSTSLLAAHRAHVRRPGKLKILKKHSDPT